MTDGDLLDFLDGLADRATARRIVTAALRDSSIRRRLNALRELDRAALAYSDAVETAETAAAEQRLGEAMRQSVRDLLAATTSAAPISSPAAPLMSELKPLLNANSGARAAGGGLWKVAARYGDAVKEFWDTVCGASSRALVTGRHPLSLPCLAPAAAASAADLQLRRETVTTADGVRIEFQQLPGSGPSRLRVFVDASLIAQELHDLGYNVAFLTLEDGGGSGTAAPAAPSAPPDRHILVIALNGEGRGFTDFIVGNAAAAAAPSVLPAPRGICRLMGVTLSHVAATG